MALERHVERLPLYGNIFECDARRNHARVSSAPGEHYNIMHYTFGVLLRVH